MPRAKGNDFSELFGYAPDDTSVPARRQWKSQDCPFIGGTCIKRISLPGSGRVVSGTCSILNRTRAGTVEEVIICPQRLYDDGYRTLKACVYDAVGGTPPVFLADEYSERKRDGSLPRSYAVMFGHNSGREISLQNAAAKLSLDWVMACVLDGKLELAVPCEVQSIDTTGNYRDAWEAYSKEKSFIPNSEHGMNWANVWKRLIPQLLLKGAVASTSTLCKQGLYFVVPDRVYVQFEKLIGKVPEVGSAGPGVLTIMTYALGSAVHEGDIRPVIHRRTVRAMATDFAESFASGRELLPLGSELDLKVSRALADL